MNHSLRRSRERPILRRVSDLDLERRSHVTEQVVRTNPLLVLVIAIAKCLVFCLAKDTRVSTSSSTGPLTQHRFFSKIETTAYRSIKKYKQHPMPASTDKQGGPYAVVVALYSQHLVRCSTCRSRSPSTYRLRFVPASNL